MASTKNVVVGMVSTTADSVSAAAGSLAAGAERKLECELGFGGTAAQDTGAQAATRVDSTAMFNVTHFSEDLDGDGKVTADEKYVKDALDGVADPNGDLKPRQLYALLLNFANMRRGYRWLKWLAVLMVASSLAQSAAMAGIAWGAGEYFLDAVPLERAAAAACSAPPPSTLHTRARAPQACARRAAPQHA